jgi:hypothetical protein
MKGEKAMTISERTLRQWRKDALMPTDIMNQEKPLIDILSFANIEMKSRILRLTQELMDNYLIKKG